MFVGRALSKADSIILTSKIWPSIDNVSPKEQGGPFARQGFSYQDEIAVGFMLDMIADTGLVKIHFETHDDLVLVRSGDAYPAKPKAEFVQVKAGEPDKLWSVADICQRRKKDAAGTSIFETSLGRDEHEETAGFRLVTLRPVVSDLAPLTYAFGLEGREPECDAMKALEKALNDKFPGLKSPKENDCGYWLANCLWDVRAITKLLSIMWLARCFKASTQTRFMRPGRRPFSAGIRIPRERSLSPERFLSPCARRSLIVTVCLMTIAKTCPSFMAP